MAKIEEKIIDDINIDNNFASKQLNSDIIPYACYYDENTIITQNGELLSTIKIPSFIANKSKDSFYNLRKDLTETCKKHSRKNNNINFWFQTIRLPVNMIPKNQNYDDYIFSNKIIDKWNNFYKWDNQYANEIYITIIIAAILSLIGLIARMIFLSHYIPFSIYKYIKEVILKSLLVLFTSIPFPIIVQHFIINKYFSFIITCLICFISTLIIIFYIGLDQEERVFVYNKLSKYNIR